MPSFALAMSLMCSLYHLARQFSTTKFVAEGALVLFCCAGGDGWKRLFLDPNKFDSGQKLNTNYGHNFGDHETFWIHPIIHFLFPQRSGMFSITLVVVVTIAIIEASGPRYRNKRLMFIAGLSVSLIPMTSGHSFLAICILAAFFAIKTCPWLRPRKWVKFLIGWIVFSIPIIVIGLPQSLVFVSRAKRGSFIQCEVIWKDYGPATVRTCLWMWWESLSIFLIIALFHCWFHMNEFQTDAYIPAFCTFLLANILRFQPGAMDNTKVFIVAWYPLACCAVSQFLVTFFSRTKILTVLLAFGATISGTLCIGKCLGMPWPVFSPQEMGAGLWAVENTPLESVFLTMNYPGVPVTAIAGRTGLMTFPGWAWTHGIYDRSRATLMSEMWRTASAKLFRDSNTKYVLKIMARQKEQFNVSHWDPGWSCVFSVLDVEVWEVVDELL
jgi:hypothetical protein